MSTPTHPPPPTGCPYQMWDGAYVLGSLSPAERREFEAHLEGCGSCTRAVRGLAGMPGLLGGIGPEVFEEPAPDPVPETLLPLLTRAVRRQQRRRSWLTAAVAAAAAVMVTVGATVALDRPGSTSTTVATPSASVFTASARPMTHVARDRMTASVALTPVAWGTRVDLTCHYPPADRSGRAGSRGEGAYALVVHTAGGRAARLATWNGLPGRTMHVSGATAARAGDIARLDVTRLDGTPILELGL